MTLQLVGTDHPSGGVLTRAGGTVQISGEAT